MKAIKIIIFASVVLFLGFIQAVETTAAQDTFKLVIYGNDEDGFIDEEGNQLNGMVYEVKKGTQVEIVLRFAGEMDPDVEEEHFVNIKLLSKADGTKPEKSTVVKKFETLDALNKESVMKWTAGEFGEKSLKLFCKTDCDGMDYMDNIKIKVVD